MNRDQLKKLENDLWSAADKLRANSDLKASEYSTPVLGLQQLAGVLYKRVVARREQGGNAGPEQEPRKRDQTRAEKQSAAA